MSRLFIVEGCDGVGKTTLVNHLYSGIDGAKAVLHAAKPTRNVYLDEYWYPISFLGDRDVVCDRWHLGEHVWPILFGREPLKPSITVLENRMFQAFDEVYGVFLVRDHDAMAECRHLDYDVDDALSLYHEAMKYSQIDWDVATLPDMLNASFPS